MKKVCTKCGKSFEPSESQIKRKRSTCYPCHRMREKIWRDKRKAAGLSWYSKKKNKLTTRLRERERSKSEKCRTYHAKYHFQRRNDEQFRQRYLARSAINNAIKRGRIKRGACEVCGRINANAHHEDYSKPLEVRWLCGDHHIERHVQIRALALKGDSE